jgi:hypothetical protein
VRTTVTLDDDVARKVKDYAHRARTSFKAALDALLRRGLASQEPRRSPRSRFRVAPHQGGFKPGVDIAKLNQLVDELEVNGFLRKERRSR